MKNDTRYLEFHHGKWRVRVAVPTRLKELYKQHHIIKPLHTDSLAVANRKKWSIVQDLFDQFEFSDRDLAVAEGTATYAVRAQHLHEAGVISDLDFDRCEAAEHEALDTLLHEVYEATSDPFEVRRIKWIAQGKSVQFLPFVDKWLDERLAMKPRQKIDYRRAITKFAAFESYLSQVNRKRVAEYIDKAFTATGSHPRTTNKDISCLSSFWKWLIKRGIVEGANPWAGQGVSDRDVATNIIKKRPFSDDEILHLLAGAAPGTMLGDAIRIAALSGMRVSEIASLTVADVRNDAFNVRIAKTKAGQRSVPIHSELKPIVSSRANGKAPSDRIFSELPAIQEGSPIEPGQAITKAFGRFRTRLGIVEKEGKARQSNVDFHSFRRWFITKAEGAGQPPHIIEFIVGHKRSGMSLGTYSGGPNTKQLKKCVNAVQLPIPTTSSSLIERNSLRA